MIGFNIKQLADCIVSAKKLEKSVKVVVAERLVDAAVEIYNNPHFKDKHMIALNRTLIDEYGVTNPPGILADYIAHLADEIRKHCWDKRIRIVLCKENADLWIVKMDLDSTFIDFQPEAENAEQVIMAVADTPSLDQINELLEKTRFKTTGQTSLHSIKQPTFVGRSSGIARWVNQAQIED